MPIVNMRIVENYSIKTAANGKPGAYTASYPAPRFSNHSLRERTNLSLSLCPNTEDLSRTEDFFQGHKTTEILHKQMSWLIGLKEM
jgi:hypothetical protein